MTLWDTKIEDEGLGLEPTGSRSSKYIEKTSHTIIACMCVCVCVSVCVSVCVCMCVYVCVCE